MRVAFDEQIFLLQRYGGVSRYFVELIRAIEALQEGVHVELPFSTVCNQHALDAWPDRFKPARGPLQPYPQLAASAVRARRRSSGVDVVHHTFYSARYLRDYRQVPKVVTIHDMIPELLGERGRFGNPHMAKREYVRRAASIICVSESARQDMVALYGEPNCPVSVIHHGVDPSFAAGGPRPTGFPERYVLFVGRRGGYKESCDGRARLPGRTGRGSEPVRPRAPRGRWNRRSGSAGAPRLGARAILCSGPVDARWTYESGSAWCCASRHQGFALPAVEASSRRCPPCRSCSSPEAGRIGGVVSSEPGDAEGARRGHHLGPRSLRRIQSFGLAAMGKGRCKAHSSPGAGAAQRTWTVTAGWARAGPGGQKERRPQAERQGQQLQTESRSMDARTIDRPA